MKAGFRWLLQEAYWALPVSLQHAAFSTWGWRLRRQRHGRAFHQYLEWLGESEWWNSEQIRDYQDTRLRAMIEHAYETVPYYNQVMRKRGLTPKDIQTQDDLVKLPVVRKVDVKRDPGQFVSRKFRRLSLRRSLTSGTTGTPLTVYLTPDALQFQWAVWWRHRARFGLKFGDWFVKFGARLPVSMGAAKPPLWRYDRALRRAYLAAYHLTPDTMGAVVKWLNTSDFAFYAGYPSAMYVLARFMEEQGLRLGNPPKCVCCGADALLPSYRRILSGVFNATVSDQYGSAEACGNFAECDRMKYHLDHEFCIAEMLPVASAPTAPLREIVFTGLANPAMPFIRYAMGDHAVVAKGACDCGRRSMTLDRIEGRTEDFVRTADGRKIIGMNQVFEWAPGVLECQIRQDSLNAIHVLVVPGRGFCERDETILERELRFRVGEEMRIVLERVPSIPRAANGKFRAVVSSLPPDGLEEDELRRSVSG